MTSQWFHFKISPSIGSGRLWVVENHGDGLLGVLPDFSNTADIACTHRGWVDNEMWVEAIPRARAPHPNLLAEPQVAAIQDRPPVLAIEDDIRREPTTAVESLPFSESEDEDELGIQANVCQTQFIFFPEHFLYFFL